MTKFKEALSCLLSEYDKLNLSYCILRNYEHLPEVNIGTDIDILINHKDIEKNDIILNRISKEFGWKLISKVHRYNISCYRYFSCEEGLTFLSFDYFHVIGWKSIILLETEEILNARRRYSTVYIPSKSHECLITFFHHILWSGHLHKDSYKKLINKEIANQEIQYIILNIFGKHSCKVINRHVMNNVYCYSNKNRNLFRLNILFYNIKHRFFRSIKLTGKMFVDNAKAVIEIPGKLLVITPELFEKLKKDGLENNLKRSCRRNRMVYYQGEKTYKLICWLSFYYHYFTSCFIPLVHQAIIIISHPIVKLKLNSKKRRNILRVRVLLSVDEKDICRYLEQ